MKVATALILFLLCETCLGQQQLSREQPCPPGKHMEGDYDRVYACVPDSETAKPERIPDPSTPHRTNSVQAANWESKFDFDDELYPSFVLAMSGRRLKAPSALHYIGDPLGVAEVVIRPVVPNANVHVEIQIEGLADKSVLDVTLPEAGQQYRIAPQLLWNYSRLAKIDQSIPATVIYRVSINGSERQETKPIRVRSVNDVPYAIAAPDGKLQDMSFLFAAYVNESHPEVQRILQEALRYRAVNSFGGYQRGPDDVRMQVFALWNALQRRNVHYSNITTASASSPTGHVQSQAVRFIDQSIQSQQANCVDGSVLFASLLYKIGVDPILVLKPGHMFIGYYLDPGHRQLEFLETTQLGAGHQPTITRNLAFSSLLHPVQSSESWQQFAGALRYATNAFNQEVRPALQQHRPQYQIIDIRMARQAGVNAIPH